MPIQYPDTKVLRKKLIKIFNEFIRLRDQHLPCISCGLRRIAHAGHFWPTSQCPQPAMRFHEKNVNGQCVNCNTFNEGNRQGYRKGLIAKYGPDVIQELDIARSQKNNQWCGFEYVAMIKHYTEKVKALKSGGY